MMQGFSSTGVGFHQGQIPRFVAADHLAEPLYAVGPAYLHELGVAYYMAVGQQQAVGGDQEAAARASPAKIRTTNVTPSLIDL